MPADLLTGLCDTLMASITVWEEDTIRSPFSPGRMQPVALNDGNRQVHSRVLTPLSQAAEVYSAAAQHVEHARSHHFFIRYDEEEIGQQLQRLILAITQHLLTTPTPAPAQDNAKPLSDTVQVTIGLLKTRISDTTLLRLARDTRLTPLLSSSDSTEGPFLH
jgi:hypothetical protein